MNGLDNDEFYTGREIKKLINDAYGRAKSKREKPGDGALLAEDEQD
jgi:hypothetical protein